MYNVDIARLIFQTAIERELLDYYLDNFMPGKPIVISFRTWGDP